MYNTQGNQKELICQGRWQEGIRLRLLECILLLQEHQLAFHALLEHTTTWLVCLQLKYAKSNVTDDENGRPFTVTVSEHHTGVSKLICHWYS